MAENITVDRDVLDFLRTIYFGVYTNPYVAASSRAYRDMNRTIRFNGMEQEQRNALRSSVDELLEKEITSLVVDGVKSQDEYDKWHFKICEKIRKIYREAGIEFNYGQSQKWLNMTIKYLFIIGEYSFDGIFQYLHVPIDNYILDVANKELKIARSVGAWSRWDQYDEQYLEYQKELRNKIDGLDPLRWEFQFWLKEARQR